MNGMSTVKVSCIMLSLTGSGLTYLRGGVKSGFEHVDPDAVVKRLYQLKGKRNIRMMEVINLLVLIA